MKEIIKNIPFSYALAAFVVTCIFIYFFAVTFSHAEATQQAGEIKTALIGTLAAIVGYFFGSSSSSKQKDQVLIDMQKSK